MSPTAELNTNTAFRPLEIGDRVLPGGPDWIWGSQGRLADNSPVEGVVIRLNDHDGTFDVEVRWGAPINHAYSYRNRPGAVDLIKLDRARTVPDGERPDSLEPGTRVVRGPDWSYGDQDGFSGNHGVVEGPHVDVPGWYHVRWDGGIRQCYRWGAEEKHDIAIVGEPGPEDVALAKARVLEVLKANWTHFEFLRKGTVLRPPWTAARLGVPWRPEWAALETEALQEALAEALAPKLGSVQNPLEALKRASKDSGWSLLGRRPEPRRTGTPHREDIEVDVTVEEDRWERRSVPVSRIYEYSLDLDRETVLGFVRENDEDGLSAYIQERIDETYSENDGDDEYGDYEVDDSGSCDDPLEYPTARRSPDGIAARLMEELAAEAEEEEEEEE